MKIIYDLIHLLTDIEHQKVKIKSSTGVCLAGTTRQYKINTKKFIIRLSTRLPGENIVIAEDVPNPAFMG